MKRGLLIALIFVCISGKKLYAQVGMTTNAPDKSAVLDMKTTGNKGILIPNVALNSTADTSGIAGGTPAQSLLIYNTNASVSGTGSAGTGYYYWDTNIWKKLITRGDVKGDNLGSHIATQNLNMASKNMLNIQRAYFKNHLEILDRNGAFPNNFSLYKNNGFLRFLSTSNGIDRLVIDENTGNVGVGTTSPKNKFSVSGGPIAQSDYADGNKYLLMGVVGASKIAHISGWGFASYAGQLTDANNIAVTNQTGIFTFNTANNGAWAERMRLANDGGLSFDGGLQIGRLPVGPLTESNLSADATGNIHKTLPTKALYTTANLSPGASQTITLTITPESAEIFVIAGNACGRTSIASFVATGKVLAFRGGQGRNILYVATPLDTDGTSYRMTSNGIVGCVDGGDGTTFNFDIVNTPTTITITNRGNIPKVYTIKQNTI